MSHLDVILTVESGSSEVEESCVAIRRGLDVDFL